MSPANSKYVSELMMFSILGNIFFLFYFIYSWQWYLCIAVSCSDKASQSQYVFACLMFIWAQALWSLLSGKFSSLAWTLESLYFVSSIKTTGCTWDKKGYAVYAWPIFRRNNDRGKDLEYRPSFGGKMYFVMASKYPKFKENGELKRRRNKKWIGDNRSKW